MKLPVWLMNYGKKMNKTASKDVFAQKVNDYLTATGKSMDEKDFYELLQHTKDRLNADASLPEIRSTIDEWFKTRTISPYAKKEMTRKIAGTNAPQISGSFVSVPNNNTKQRYSARFADTIDRHGIDNSSFQTVLAMVEDAHKVVLNSKQYEALKDYFTAKGLSREADINKVAKNVSDWVKGHVIFRPDRKSGNKEIPNNLITSKIKTQKEQRAFIEQIKNEQMKHEDTWEDEQKEKGKHPKDEKADKADQARTKDVTPKTKEIPWNKFASKSKIGSQFLLLNKKAQAKPDEIPPDTGDRAPEITPKEYEVGKTIPYGYKETVEEISEKGIEEAPPDVKPHLQKLYNHQKQVTEINAKIKEIQTKYKKMAEEEGGIAELKKKLPTKDKWMEHHLDEISYMGKEVFEGDVPMTIFKFKNWIGYIYNRLIKSRTVPDKQKLDAVVAKIEEIASDKLPEINKMLAEMEPLVEVGPLHLHIKESQGVMDTVTSWIKGIGDWFKNFVGLMDDMEGDVEEVEAMATDLFPEGDSEPEPAMASLDKKAITYSELSEMDDDEAYEKYGELVDKLIEIDAMIWEELGFEYGNDLAASDESKKKYLNAVNERIDGGIPPWVYLGLEANNFHSLNEGLVFLGKFEPNLEGITFYHFGDVKLEGNIEASNKKAGCDTKKDKDKDKDKDKKKKEKKAGWMDAPSPSGVPFEERFLGKDIDEAKLEVQKLSEDDPAGYYIITSTFGFYWEKSTQLHVFAPSDATGGIYWKAGIEKSFTESQWGADSAATPVLSSKIASKKKAGRIKGPGIPDGTGPRGGTPACPISKDKDKKKKELKEKKARFYEDDELIAALLEDPELNEFAVDDGVPPESVGDMSNPEFEYWFTENRHQIMDYLDAQQEPVTEPVERLLDERVAKKKVMAQIEHLIDGVYVEYDEGGEVVTVETKDGGVVSIAVTRDPSGFFYGDDITIDADTEQAKELAETYDKGEYLNELLDVAIERNASLKKKAQEYITEKLYTTPEEAQAGLSDYKSTSSDVEEYEIVEDAEGGTGKFKIKKKNMDGTQPASNSYAELGRLSRKIHPETGIKTACLVDWNDEFKVVKWLG